MQTLYTGGTKGTIHGWDITGVVNNERGVLKERLVLKGHTDMVMDLKAIGNSNLLASARYKTGYFLKNGSLDSSIVLWDMGTNSVHMRLNGHIKGVFALAYAPEQRLLFSASFDRDVLVWNPMVETAVARLKGHHTSLIGIQTMEGTNQVITADMDGWFKAWDT